MSNMHKLLRTLVTLFCMGLVFPTSAQSVESDQARLETVQHLLKIERFEQAKKLLLPMIRAVPRNPSAWVLYLEVLAKNGEGRRAEHLLQNLIRSAQNDGEAAIYGDALSKLYKRVPIQMRGHFSIRPSTNITRAASQTLFSTNVGTFEIDNGGQAQSGLGFDIGASASYRVPLSFSRTFEVSGRLGRVWYSDKELRHWNGTIHADITQRLPQQTLRFGAYVQRSQYDENGPSATDSSNRWQYGISALWSSDRGTARRTVTTRLEHRDYDEKRALSGLFASAGVEWSQALSKRGRLSWGASVERSLPQLEYQRYKGINFSLGYSHLVTKNTRLGANISARFREYDTDFPLVGHSRADQIFSVGLSASDQRLKIAGAKPTLSCAYTEHRSNIALYETNYVDCRVSFSYSF